MKIAILGGTGKEGKGLAHRWAQAGHEILIGSRSLEKAQAAAQDVNAGAGRQVATGLEPARSQSPASRCRWAFCRAWRYARLRTRHTARSTCR